MPGEKIGEGYVEVTVDIDDAQIGAATEKATAKVDDGFSKAAPGIGTKAGHDIGAGLETELGSSGDRSARNFAENFEQHRSEFTAFAKTFGDDFFKQFQGNSEGALNELNKQFNAKFDSGGLSASSLFFAQFDKRVKGAATSDAEGLMGTLTKAMEDAGVEGGDLFGSGIVDGASNALKVFSQLPPEAQAGIAGAAVAAGVIFGSALAAAADAAILGAVGGIGLVAGILAETKDPRVSSAFSDLKTHLTDDLQEAASSFVGPLTRGVTTLEGAFDAAMPNLERGFSTLAPAIDRLATGAGILVQELSEGFADAGPGIVEVLNAMADILPIIGGGMKIFLDEIATGGPGAADIVRLIGYFVSGLIIALGNGIETGAVLFQGIEDGAKFALWPLEALLKAMSGLPGVGGAAKDALKALNDMFDGGSTKSKNAANGVDLFTNSTTDAGNAANKAASSIADLYDAFSKTANAALQADQTSNSYRDALNSLGKSAQQNGVALTGNSAAALANRQAFDQAAQAALSNADAVKSNALAQGKDGVTAANLYDQALAGNISQLASSARQAGYNRGQVAQMIATMFGIPKNIATLFATPGAAAAKQAADALQKAILGIPLYRRIDIEYDEVHYTSYQQIQPGHGGNDPGGGKRFGGIHHAASGLVNALNSTAPAGIYSNGPFVMFAEPETGSEAFIPQLTTDPARAVQVLQQAAQWYHLAVVPAGTATGSTAATAGAAATPGSARAAAGGGISLTQVYNVAPDPETRFNATREAKKTLTDALGGW